MMMANFCFKYVSLMKTFCSICQLFQLILLLKENYYCLFFYQICQCLGHPQQ